MSGDDIRAGDVVVCVDASPPAHKLFRPLAIGGVYRVIAVLPTEWTDGTWGVITIRDFHCIDPGELDLDGWRDDRFRKLRPAEDCFIAASKEWQPLETEVS